MTMERKVIKKAKKMPHDIELSDEEWNEMDAIRRAIGDGPPAVSFEKMERFSELFVRTLPYEGDTIASSITIDNATA